jgi:SpoVK/Ycf46/Vps4 family AAA+-type ATPase
MGGSEPSDALRVVNALLTQLDKLKHRKNVLVLTTSNISEAIGASAIRRPQLSSHANVSRQTTRSLTGRTSRHTSACRRRRPSTGSWHHVCLS